MSENENPQTAAANNTDSKPIKKATIRLSQRELNIITLCVVGAIVGLLGFMGFRVVMSFKSQHDIVVGQDNLQSIYKAMRGYAQDWDNHLPPAKVWSDAMQGYLTSSGKPGGADAFLKGPGDTGDVGYVYNDEAEGYNEETGRFDARPGDPRSPVESDKLILLIERVGVPRNAHISLPPQGNAAGEAKLFKELAFVHGSDDSKNATTLVLFANGTIKRYLRGDFKK